MRTNSLPFVLMFLLPCVAAAQDAQLKPAPSPAPEPVVKSLSDVRPGVPRTAVLAGLASGYELRKKPDLEGFGDDFEMWNVVSRVPPFESASVSFRQGKTFGVSRPLLASSSPDVGKFVDALQSALHESADVPNTESAAAMIRQEATSAGEHFTDEQIAVDARERAEFWKLRNQRFGMAQIGMWQDHYPTGDFDTLTIAIGGRTFEVSLIRFSGGRMWVTLSEDQSSLPLFPK